MKIKFLLSIPLILLIFLIAKAALNSPSQSTYNFLILGLDKRDDEFEKTSVTDTILICQLNIPRRQISLFSLPRDLWDYSLNMKINNLYPYYKAKTADYFVPLQTEFTRLSGLNFAGTLVITTQNLIDITSKIGGIDVNLDQGFTDHQYPNPAYIASPSAKTPIYITVSYPAGNIHLDSTNITPFVRSRKSSDTAATGGTDLGRIKRQQLLLDALITKIKSQQFLSQITHLYVLINFWHGLEKNIPDSLLVSIALHNSSALRATTINRLDIPVGNTQNSGVIYHPDRFINQQWVFVPRSSDYHELQLFLKGQLHG